MQKMAKMFLSIFYSKPERNILFQGNVIASDCLNAFYSDNLKDLLYLDYGRNKDYIPAQVFVTLIHLVKKSIPIRNSIDIVKIDSLENAHTIVKSCKTLEEYGDWQAGNNPNSKWTIVSCEENNRKRIYELNAPIYHYLWNDRRHLINEDGARHFSASRRFIRDGLTYPGGTIRSFPIYYVYIDPDEAIKLFEKYQIYAVSETTANDIWNVYDYYKKNKHFYTSNYDYFRMETAGNTLIAIPSGADASSASAMLLRQFAAAASTDPDSCMDINQHIIALIAKQSHDLLDRINRESSVPKYMMRSV